MYPCTWDQRVVGPFGIVIGGVLGILGYPMGDITVTVATASIVVLGVAITILQFLREKDWNKKNSNPK